MTSRQEIAGWFDEGVAKGASHMIVVCDTFDYSDYPVFTTPDTFWEQHKSHNGPNMTKIIEVYDLALDKESQLSERRAFHLPAPTAHEVEAFAVIKLDGGLIGYRFRCSCGRDGGGRHSTPAEAIEAGQAHIPTSSEEER